LGFTEKSGIEHFLGFLQVKPGSLLWFNREKNTILHAEVGKFACKPHAVKTRAYWRQDTHTQTLSCGTFVAAPVAGTPSAPVSGEFHHQIYFIFVF